jgi:hypothetical protein
MSFLGHPRGAEWSFGDKVITPTTRSTGLGSSCSPRPGLTSSRALPTQIPDLHAALSLVAEALAGSAPGQMRMRSCERKARGAPTSPPAFPGSAAAGLLPSGQCGRARGRACAWPSHACLSGPVGNGDVTTPSRMEQSVEAVGGPSRLVQRDTAQTDGLRARNALRSSGVGSGAACASGRIHAAASAGAGACLSFEGARPWSSALRVGRSGSGRRNLESGRL